jgi:F-type H+-transporting ATPase subunit b
MAGGGGGLAGLVAPYLNVILLAIILVLLLKKKLGIAQGEKHAGVKTALEEAENLRVQAETMVKEYEGKLTSLDKEIEEILKEAKNQGEAERARILARAKVLAEKIREDALRDVEAELEKTKKRIQHEAVVEAAGRAMELLRKKIGENEHQVFTQEFLTQLEADDGSRLG